MALAFFIDSGHAFGTSNIIEVEPIEIGKDSLNIAIFPEIEADGISFTNNRSTRTREKQNSGRFKKANHFINVFQEAPTSNISFEATFDAMSMVLMSLLQNRHKGVASVIVGTTLGTALHNTVVFTPFNKRVEFTNGTVYGTTDATSYIGASGDAYGFDTAIVFDNMNTTFDTNDDMLILRHGMCSNVKINQSKDKDLTVTADTVYRTIELANTETVGSTVPWINDLTQALFPNFAGYNDASVIWTDEHLTINVQRISASVGTSLPIDETWTSLDIEMNNNAEAVFALTETFPKTLKFGNFDTTVTLNGEFKNLSRVTTDYDYNGTFTWTSGSGTTLNSLKMIFPNLKLQPFVPEISLNETVNTLVFDTTTKGTLPPVIVEMKGQYIQGIKYLS